MLPRQHPPSLRRAPAHPHRQPIDHAWCCPSRLSTPHSSSLCAARHAYADRTGRVYEVPATALPKKNPAASERAMNRSLDSQLDAYVLLDKLDSTLAHQRADRVVRPRTAASTRGLSRATLRPPSLDASIDALIQLRRGQKGKTTTTASDRSGNSAPVRGGTRTVRPAKMVERSSTLPSRSKASIPPRNKTANLEIKVSNLQKSIDHQWTELFMAEQSSYLRSLGINPDTAILGDDGLIYAASPSPQRRTLATPPEEIPTARLATHDLLGEGDLPPSRSPTCAKPMPRALSEGSGILMTREPELKRGPVLSQASSNASQQPLASGRLTVAGSNLSVGESPTTIPVVVSAPSKSPYLPRKPKPLQQTDGALSTDEAAIKIQSLFRGWKQRHAAKSLWDLKVKRKDAIRDYHAACDRAVKVLRRDKLKARQEAFLFNDCLQYCYIKHKLQETFRKSCDKIHKTVSFEKGRTLLRKFAKEIGYRITDDEYLKAAALVAFCKPETLKPDELRLTEVSFLDIYFYFAPPAGVVLLSKRDVESSWLNPRVTGEGYVDQQEIKQETPLTAVVEMMRARKTNDPTNIQAMIDSYMDED
eukprot:TRINITY_DN12543_c1_g1_i11.p1 TRINITY_DN12543_c1_g1~~TRINITY_DN12543_c1_g1_i11.p1  ORF type:complete len:590 (+),score=88.52 TRINITY_DN12543_c1_g1_i11:3141-4910(+)